MKIFNNDVFKGSNNQLSSKRITGFILTIISVIIIFLAFHVQPIGVIHESILIIIGELLATSTALLGLGVIEKDNKNKNENE